MTRTVRRKTGLCIHKMCSSFHTVHGHDLLCYAHKFALFAQATFSFWCVSVIFDSGGGDRNNNADERGRDERIN